MDEETGDAWAAEQCFPRGVQYRADANLSADLLSVGAAGRRTRLGGRPASGRPGKRDRQAAFV